jgi:phosphofructokinase-like protein
MPTTIRRIGVLTGGGDCPGLNAVIRAVTKDALLSGLSVIGFREGFAGLIENRVVELSYEQVSGILHTGGTILGTHNKANPKRCVVGKNPDGSLVFADKSDDCLRHLREHAIDALVVIGGDGTMTIAADFAKHGVNVIGVPKTIDNDLYGTELTFGFLTAVQIATDAIDRLQTTAASHHRIMVVELMGRHAGWITLYAGIAGGADVILLPEMPFSLDAVAAAIKKRRVRGAKSSIVCVARVDPTSPDPIRLGGIGKYVADRLEDLTGIESRFCVLGHLQRGGSPIAADRILGTRFGHHAMTLLKRGATSRMVAIQGGAESGVTDVDILNAAGKQRLVPVGKDGVGEHPLLAAARAVGTTFGV